MASLWFMAGAAMDNLKSIPVDYVKTNASLRPAIDLTLEGQYN
jgi:hypothetical protein